MDEAEFGSYLRTARVRRGLTVRQLSVYTHVSNTYISQLERGRKRRPSPTVLLKLATGLRLPYAQLMAAAGYLPEESPTLAQTTAREIAETIYALMERLSPEERLSVKEDILGYLQVRFGKGVARRSGDHSTGDTAGAPDQEKK